MKTTIQIENMDIPVMVSILLVEDEEICRINREYRNQNNITDVLSFPMLEMKEGCFIDRPGEMDMEEGKLFLGDIAISVPRAMEQAMEYGHSIERELAFLTVHGLLHLLGYDHDCTQREEMMRKRQGQVLSEMGLGLESK